MASNCNGDQVTPLISSGKSKNSKRELSRAEKTELHVNFSEGGEVKERREKYLTAKYGSHQMNLIRKRLAVEMWMYDEIQKFTSEANPKNEIEIDIDDLLDLEDDNHRQEHIKELMTDMTTQNPDHITKFIRELLEKMKTL